MVTAYNISDTGTGSTLGRVQTASGDRDSVYGGRGRVLGTLASNNNNNSNNSTNSRGFGSLARGGTAAVSRGSNNTINPGGGGGGGSRDVASLGLLERAGGAGWEEEAGTPSLGGGRLLGRGHGDEASIGRSAPTQTDL